MSRNRHDTASSLGTPISTDEALELAAQVSEMAKGGLPLEGGLRALADELSPGRLPAVLREMAGRLESGSSACRVPDLPRAAYKTDALTRTPLAVPRPVFLTQSFGPPSCVTLSSNTGAGTRPNMAASIECGMMSVLVAVLTN